MVNKTYQLNTFTCPSCTMKIEGALKKTKGVKDYDVLFNSSKVKVTFDEEIIKNEEVKEILIGLGYEILKEI